jgi:hypothetical protein
MSYLEKISPSYLEMIRPLEHWKILSLKNLREDSDYQGSASGFYKIIKKLEQHNLLDSFINAWSNEKYLYLSPLGLKGLGLENRGLNLNREHRLHDSIVTKVARVMTSWSFVQRVRLNFHNREELPLLERVPDCFVEAKLNKPLHLAVEVELTQKSRDRLEQIFRTYSESKVIHHVLYITDKRSILKSYTDYLRIRHNEFLAERFLFLINPNLVKGNLDLMNSQVYFKNRETTLREIFNQ